MNNIASWLKFRIQYRHQQDEGISRRKVSARAEIHDSLLSNWLRFSKYRLQLTGSCTIRAIGPAFDTLAIYVHRLSCFIPSSTLRSSLLYFNPPSSYALFVSSEDSFWYTRKFYRNISRIFIAESILLRGVEKTNSEM